MKGTEVSPEPRVHRHSLIAACCWLALSPATEAQAQSLPEFRAAALAALGTPEITNIEFSASGWDACLGQPYAIAEGWARWELREYRRVLDYRNGRSSHSAQRRAGMDPGRIGGCGAQPDAMPAPQQGFINDTERWPNTLPLWLTPHGFLQLMTASETTLTQEGSGWQVNLSLTREDVQYTSIGYFDAEHQLERIDTEIDDAIFGNMPVQAVFGDYRDFGVLSYPESYTLNQGGFPVLALTIENASQTADTLAAPPRRPIGMPAPPERGPEFQEIGPGIFAIFGAYQSVAVEFSEHIVVLDGLQHDARVRELIGIVKKAIPDKPIRYIVSTHNHFDHAYGVRQFLAEGATLLTHQSNVAFFEEALATPRTLRRVVTEPDEVPVRVQGVDGKLTLSDDAGQVVELYALAPSPHAADMLIAWLPSIKTVVEADILQPWINPIFAGGGDSPHPMLPYLAQELQKLGLDYESFVPIHTPPNPPLMSRADLDAALGNAAP